MLYHELSHRKHWQNVYNRYKSSSKYASIKTAKDDLEHGLRSYVHTQMGNDPLYLQRTISINASKRYVETGQLNELIADASVRIKQDTLMDQFLKIL